MQGAGPQEGQYLFSRWDWGALGFLSQLMLPHLEDS